MSHHKKPVQPLPPGYKLFLNAGTLEDPKHRAVLNKAVARQPFLSQIDLLFSTTSTAADIPSELKTIIEQYTFSYARINPAELLCSEFMNSYVRGKTPGSLVLLSSSHSPEDVIAIDGRGHLVLSLCKDTHSTFGIAGHPSRYGPKHDRYYVEIDLTPDYMRAGKPGFERIRTGLRKLGEKDLVATCTNATGKSERVEFPTSASTKTILSPRVTCTRSEISLTSELSQFQEEINTHDFRNAKTRKRKRSSIVEEVGQDDEDTGIFVQDLLEAVASVELVPSDRTRGTGSAVLSVSIEGLLHPQLAQELLNYFSTTETYPLISMTASTMSHSPLERAIKRQSGGKPDMRGKEERPVDSGVLDGWTVLFSTPKEGKTRFVFVDSATS